MARVSRTLDPFAGHKYWGALYQTGKYVSPSNDLEYSGFYGYWDGDFVRCYHTDVVWAIGIYILSIIGILSLLSYRGKILFYDSILAFVRCDSDASTRNHHICRHYEYHVVRSTCARRSNRDTDTLV